MNIHKQCISEDNLFNEVVLAKSFWTAKQNEWNKEEVSSESEFKISNEIK